MSELKEKFTKHTSAISIFLRDEHLINKVIEKTCSCMNNGKLIIAGNGGSAADAQHVAAEFTGRFKLDRKPLPALALTVDTSAITAIGNDFGFDSVFSRQLSAIASPGDLLWILSTSGNSQNLVELTHVAREKKVETVAFLGSGGGTLKNLVDTAVIIASDETDIIQEAHLFIYHYIIEQVESTYG
jgi:D-sedoheptulose 7-phosphate isomerase